MKTDRLNTFTDGVLAIVLTIMVLELPLPHGDGLAALRPILPLLGAYALAFVNIGIFWNNHHHLMTLVEKVDGSVLWANLFLLFWLSLVPFVIRWIGEVGISSAPVAAYGVVLVMASAAYLLLERTIVIAEGERSKLRKAVGGGAKEIISFALYVVGAGLSFVWVWAAIASYVVVAALWFLPDRRVEKTIDEGAQRP